MYGITLSKGNKASYYLVFQMPNEIIKNKCSIQFPKPQSVKLLVYKLYAN